jgi:hypothetical protein
LIGHENEYDEILRMFSVVGMSVTAELNCGYGYTTELRFAGWTSNIIIVKRCKFQEEWLSQVISSQIRALISVSVNSTLIVPKEL